MKDFDLTTAVALVITTSLASNLLWVMAFGPPASGLRTPPKGRRWTDCAPCRGVLAGAWDALRVARRERQSAMCPAGRSDRSRFKGYRVSPRSFRRPHLLRTGRPGRPWRTTAGPSRRRRGRREAAMTSKTIALRVPRRRLHRLHLLPDAGSGRISDGLATRPRRDVVARVSRLRRCCRLRCAASDSCDSPLGPRRRDHRRIGSPDRCYGCNPKVGALTSSVNVGVRMWRTDHSQSSVALSYSPTNHMANLIVFAVFIAAGVLFAWFSLRLRSVKSVAVRWIGAGLTGLIALALSLTCITPPRSVFTRRQYSPQCAGAGTAGRRQRRTD